MKQCVWTWTWTAVLLLTPTAAANDDARSAIERAIAPVLANPPATGLLIFEVAPDTQAAKARFQPGDVLTHYDGQPVESLADLSRIARTVFQEKRKLLILVRRGEQEIEAEFDPAPLGLRLVPVRAKESRLLWRPQTQVEFDPDAIAKVLQSGDHWELLELAGKPVGWAHSLLTPHQGKMLLRVQSSIENDQLSQQRDVILTFRNEAYLPLQSIRLMAQNRLIFDFHRDNGKLAGERTGIPDAAPVPNDAVSAYLSGYLAAMMPREAGACLHCSYLADSSLHAAPFSDLYCTGPEELEIGEQKLPTWCYEQTVFGERVAMYWVNESGQVVQVRYGNGIQARRVSFVEIKKQFPNAGEGFPPIDSIPVLAPASNLQAN